MLLHVWARWCPLAHVVLQLMSKLLLPCGQHACACVPLLVASHHRCLQDKKNEKDFSKSCKEEVEAYEQETSKDYRLNFRLNKNCAKDIQTLCGSVCSESDGNVGAISSVRRRIHTDACVCEGLVHNAPYCMSNMLSDLRLCLDPISCSYSSFWMFRFCAAPLSCSCCFGLLFCTVHMCLTWVHASSDVLMCQQVCGGKVLRCLTDNVEDIKAEACRKEVRGLLAVGMLCSLLAGLCVSFILCLPSMHPQKQ